MRKIFSFTLAKKMQQSGQKHNTSKLLLGDVGLRPNAISGAVEIRDVLRFNFCMSRRSTNGMSQVKCGESCKGKSIAVAARLK